LPSNGSKDPRKDQKESLIFRLHPEREGRQLIFQLGTSDPERAVAAARLVAGDVAGIDVNAGCPKPFSTSGGMGAALLQTPEKLVSILEALVKEIVPEFEIGISVKIRLLETPERTEALVRKLCATGITGLTIHCRTTPMRPRERAIREQLKMISGICKEFGVACLMNGDVENREQAYQLMEEYNVDGAMIATAAERNSSVFRAQADGGVADWKEVVTEYLKISLQVENRWGNTKFLLGHLVPGKNVIYRSVTASKSYSQICDILDIPELKEMAKKVDDKLEISPEAQERIKQQAQQNKKQNKKDQAQAQAQAQRNENLPTESTTVTNGKRTERSSPSVEEREVKKAKQEMETLEQEQPAPAIALSI
jgi:tRNA-dihydrouridine synthase 2